MFHRYPALPSFPPAPRRPEQLLKLAEVAKMLGLSAVTVRRRVRDGSLPHLRIKSRLYFHPSEVHMFLEAHRGNGMLAWAQKDA